VGVRVDFRWLVDLVVVSSWCRPQPPSRRKLSTMVDKKFQVGCISTIITKHRSDRRAADPSTIVSRLSLSRLPWLQHAPTSGVVSNWGQNLVASSSCSRQPPCGLAGRLPCHQRFRFGSSQGTRSLLDPPSLKVASQPVPPYHSSFGEFCRWLFSVRASVWGGNSVTLPGLGIAPNCFLQGTESAPDTRSAVDPTGKPTWCQQIALTPV
jgi:hypothetical protein